MIVLVIFAFIAGIITVLSPCILPILPIILSSSVGGGKKRPFGIVTGFVLSFTFFTLFLSTIVRLTNIPADSLRLISVFVIAGFGLTLLIPRAQLIIEQLFVRLSRLVPVGGEQKTGFSGGLLIGFSLGLLWTPCVGPILASVISLAITGSVNAGAFLITLAYSTGTAIPMLLIIFAGQTALQKVPWLVANTIKIQRIFGLVMIATAIGIFFNVDRKFQTYILQKFPQYGVGLTSFEDNEAVREQLEGRGSGSKEDMGKPMNELLNQNIFPDAPEIIPGGEWFNSDPLTLEQLRGKVVVVDFWTYTCINCQRTLPYLRSWYEKYKDMGLVILGVHSPEFEFEKDADNVSQAIKDFELAYPIVQDNNFATWRAYNNRYWPAKYFVDRNGKIRGTHFGEGAYNESEKLIQQLLSEEGHAVDLPINNPGYTVETKTPEIYLGFSRMQNLISSQEVNPNVETNYTLPGSVLLNRFAFGGLWTVSEEYSQAANGSELLLRFHSKDVFLVMRNRNGGSGRVRVLLDGKEIKTVTVTADQLYELIELPVSAEHDLKLEFLDDNVEIYAFTFG